MRQKAITAAKTEKWVSCHRGDGNASGRLVQMPGCMVWVCTCLRCVEKSGLGVVEYALK